MQFKLTILCEDQARMGFLDKKFYGQHGLAFFIEGDRNILFDTGPSEVLLTNAGIAEIDLAGTDLIVLSHGHWDHTDGLPHLAENSIRPQVLCHPEVFRDRRNKSGAFNGMALSKQKTADTFNLRESTGPVQISDTTWFLGEIPRKNNFEATQTQFHYEKDGQSFPDFLPDDTALAMRTDKGLVVVSGCSHAGICNICEYAKKVSGENHLHMVIGGFHLLDDAPALDRTIAYFQAEKPDRLYPMHCTAMPALAEFHAAFGIDKLCTGDVIKMH